MFCLLIALKDLQKWKISVTWKKCLFKSWNSQKSLLIQKNSLYNIIMGKYRNSFSDDVNKFINSFWFARRPIILEILLKENMTVYNIPLLITKILSNYQNEKFFYLRYIKNRNENSIRWQQVNDNSLRVMWFLMLHLFRALFWLKFCII